MLRSLLLLVPAAGTMLDIRPLQAQPVPPRVMAVPAARPAVPRRTIPLSPAVVVPPAHATVKLPSVRITPPQIVVEKLGALLSDMTRKPK